MKFKRVLGLCLCLCLLWFCGGEEKEQTASTVSTDYNDLVRLFKEFREYQKPEMVNGVPDYTQEAMTQQIAELTEYRLKLADIDPSGWPIEQRVDYEILRAEMNGLEFDHRVLRPWSRDPSFYAIVTTYEPDVPAREGPEIYGVLYFPDYEFPLEGEQKEEFALKLRAIPDLLAQAKENLTDKGKDLWYYGIQQKDREIGVLTGLSQRFSETNPDLVVLVDSARAAVEDFKAWLEEENKSMPQTSDGIGVENFNWYMKHVHLVPFDWKEQVDICRRELERSWTALKLEEIRNRDLPPLKPAESLDELRSRLKAAVDEFMNFLREKNIFTVPDYMILSTEVDSYTPPERQSFFTIVEYHHYLALRPHMIHWLEKQREARNDHPIRGVPLLYNIWDSRAEGLATGFEEIMLQAGLLDDVPRVRELTYILLAFRAARALGDLMVHSGDWTVQEAVDFAVKATPRGWVKPDGRTIWGDIGLYLRQPGYGTSYVYGKIQLERLIADRARLLGDSFRLKDFFDDYFSRGIIPASLLRWEMTGFDDAVKKLAVIE
ncbi:MAG: DUF885 family protein [Candidatus Aminicenantes bacterium]|nr:DUF885 family protein [Candidatus Aminicenantes bacterium]